MSYTKNVKLTKVQTDDVLFIHVPL